MLQQDLSEKIVQLSERNVHGLRKVWVLDKIVFIQTLNGRRLKRFFSSIWHTGTFIRIHNSNDYGDCDSAYDDEVLVMMMMITLKGLISPLTTMIIIIVIVMIIVIIIIRMNLISSLTHMQHAWQKCPPCSPWVRLPQLYTSVQRRGHWKEQRWNHKK